MKLYVASAGTGKTHTLVEELLALAERSQRKLASPGFREKAPKEVVEAEEARLRENLEQAERIREALSQIG